MPNNLSLGCGDKVYGEDGLDTSAFESEAGRQLAMGAAFGGTKLAAVVVTTPLDTLKTRMQANLTTTYPEVVASIFNKSGWRGFYRGTPYTLARMCLSAGLKGAVTTDAAKYFNSQLAPETLDSVPQAGFVIASPIVASIDTVLGPLERFKTFAVTNDGKKDVGVVSRMQRKFESRGGGAVLRDMYRGAGVIALDKTIVVGGFHLLDGEVERQAKKFRGAEGLTAHEKMIAAGFIGIALSLIHMPLSVAKTHITKKGSDCRHLVSAFNNILKEKGMSALYRGHVASMGNCIIGTMVYSFAVIMAQNINGMANHENEKSSPKVDLVTRENNAVIRDVGKEGLEKEREVVVKGKDWTSKMRVPSSEKPDGKLVR